jgi:periplasmic protein TonB
MNRLFRFLVPLILAASTAAVGQDSNKADVPKPAPEVQRVRVSSGVAVGLLIKKVQLHYPKEAKQTGIQGRVLLQAEISKDGAVQNLLLISGHPMLAQAAIEAVKKWKYKPYLLNRQPVAMETQIAVDFKLQ